MSDPLATPQTPTTGNDQALRALTNDLVTRTELSINIRQRIVAVNEEKIELCLHRHLDRMGRRQEWITPAGIALTLLLTLLTTTFHDTLFVSAALWQAICIVSLFLTCAWLIKTLRTIPHASSIADVVRELREESQRNTES